MVMGALERLNPPRALGDMVLFAKLGQGGMASVYLAVVGHAGFERIAAVKMLRTDAPGDDYKTRFLDEARVVTRLQHNNLVSVRSAGEIGGQLYIAMEAIAGRDLSDVWDRCAEVGRAFPVPLAVHLIREVLRGLHYAHTFPGLSLVHRDVSPSNVLIDWEGAVRLADFGLATSTLKDSLTMPGVVFGKVGYMSPEQALRGPLDPRTDIYACGAILWELLTGRPLRSTDELETECVARFQAVPPSEYSRRVDDDLDHIVARALSHDRDRRWDSAEDMLGALTRWLATHAPETSQEEVAGFLQQLFTDARQREHEERESLVQEVLDLCRLRGGANNAARRAEASGVAIVPHVLTPPQGVAKTVAQTRDSDSGAATMPSPASGRSRTPRSASGPNPAAAGRDGESKAPKSVPPPPPIDEGLLAKARRKSSEYARREGHQDDTVTIMPTQSDAAMTQPVGHARLVERIEEGTVIAERYRVQSKIGRGGMGTVYLGEHVTVGRSVAIKVLTHEWSSNRSVTQRFRAEARAASAAGHANIVEVFDAGTLPDGRLYLVMEFLIGRNLFEELREVGSMPVFRACRVIRDVCRAVRAAHEVGVVHRDLKPDNVMLVRRASDEGETVKVLDFGISASADDAGERRLTMPGRALGTPEYMAPEQGRGQPATTRFDIYSIGVIFYEMLVGSPPFQGTNFVDIMHKKGSETPPSVTRVRPDVPLPVVRLIDRCLAKRPEDRPRSADEVLAVIEGVLAQAPSPSRSLAISSELSVTDAASESHGRGDMGHEDDSSIEMWEARSRRRNRQWAGVGFLLASGIVAIVAGGGVEGFGRWWQGASEGGSTSSVGASSQAGAPQGDGMRVAARAQPAERRRGLVDAAVVPAPTRSSSEGAGTSAGDLQLDAGSDAPSRQEQRELLNADDVGPPSSPGKSSSAQRDDSVPRVGERPAAVATNDAPGPEPAKAARSSSVRRATASRRTGSKSHAAKSTSTKSSGSKSSASSSDTRSGSGSLTCLGIRKELAAAEAARQWTTLLGIQRRMVVERCWKASEETEKFGIWVRAYKETKQWRKCVEYAAKAPKAFGTERRLCERRLVQEKNAGVAAGQGSR